MSANLGTLVLKFVGDTTGLESSFKKISQIAIGTATGLGLFKIGGAMISGAQKFVGLLADGVGYVVEMGTEFERAQTAFETLVGSTKLGKDLFQEIQKLATETPFKAAQLIENAKMMLGHGIRPDELIDTMRRIGDIAAGTGSSIDRIALAYGQVLSKGKLTAEELTRQLGNAGVGAETIADALGITSAKLFEMMDKGQASAGLIKIAFKNLTSEGGRFFHAMDRDLQTVGGRWDQLKETIELAAGRLGMALFEKFPIGETINKITQAIGTINAGKIADQIGQIAKGLRGAAEAAIDFAAGLAGVGKLFFDKLVPGSEDFGKSLELIFKNILPAFTKTFIHYINWISDSLVSLAKILLDDVLRPMVKLMSDLKGENIAKSLTLGLLDVVSFPGRQISDWNSKQQGVREALSPSAIDAARNPNMVDATFDQLIGNLDRANNSMKAALPSAEAIEGAFKKAAGTGKEFLNSLPGKGGVSPVGAKQEAAMAAAREVKIRNDAFFEAMEKSMPGFKTGVGKLLSEIADPEKMLKPYDYFIRNSNMLGAALSRPELFGGVDQINRAILQNYNQASGSLNNTANGPAVTGLNFLKTEAASIVAQAAGQIGFGGAGGQDVKDKLDRIRIQAERQTAIDEETLKALKEFMQSQTGGVPLGGLN